MKKKIKLAFQGEKGAYSHLACLEVFPKAETKGCSSFEEVFLKGLAPDGGLFVPKKISLYTSQEIEKLRGLSYKELAAKIISNFCSKEFNETEIKDLVHNAYKNFRVKDVVTIKKLGKLNLLELFHGPTLAFKDIAMQVIGNMYESILEKNELIALSKSDLISEDKNRLSEIIEKKIGKKPFIFSNISNDGIEDLVKALFDQCPNNND